MPPAIELRCGCVKHPKHDVFCRRCRTHKDVWSDFVEKKITQKELHYFIRKHIQEGK